MNQTPQVTIVVPCYNYAHYLPATLQSIAAQDVDRWECIIVDDGSTDNTFDVGQEWAQRDARFIYLRQNNAGLAAARNVGIRSARGKYIQFIDADDLIEPGKISRQIRLIESLSENALVYSSFQYLDDSMATFDPDPNSLVAKRTIIRSLIFDWERGFSIPIHTFLFKAVQLANAGGFTEGLPTHEDIDLHIRLAINDVEFVHHAEKLALYRIHSSSMARNHTRMQAGYLMALGNILTNVRSPRLRFQLFVRYGTEVARCLVDFIKGREISVKRSVFQIGHPYLSLLSVLLLPIFLPTFFLAKTVQKTRSLFGIGRPFSDSCQDEHITPQSDSLDSGPQATK